MTILRLHPFLVVAYLAIASIAVGVLVNGISKSNGDVGKPSKKRDGHRLELIVNSTEADSASISYVTPGSDPIEISQHHKARLPWSKTFSGVPPLQIGFNLKAVQSGAGRLTCIVKMDGDVIERKSTRGQSAIVTCSP